MCSSDLSCEWSRLLRIHVDYKPCFLTSIPPSRSLFLPIALSRTVVSGDRGWCAADEKLEWKRQRWRREGAVQRGKWIERGRGHTRSQGASLCSLAPSWMLSDHVVECQVMRHPKRGRGRSNSPRHDTDRKTTVSMNVRDGP